MNINLVVTRPFGGLSRGALITDPPLVASILSGENKLDVVRVVAAATAAAAGGN